MAQTLALLGLVVTALFAVVEPDPRHARQYKRRRSSVVLAAIASGLFLASVIAACGELIR